jgi:hypothetical protein
MGNENSLFAVAQDGIANYQLKRWRCGNDRKLSIEQDQQDALFVFSLLRNNSLYMFQALLAHLQVALHK